MQQETLEYFLGRWPRQGDISVDRSLLLDERAEPRAPTPHTAVDLESRRERDDIEAAAAFGAAEPFPFPTRLI